MRLDSGNYSWGSEAVTRKTRIIAVVYNASNNELVRTNTLVKGAVVQIDATPFKQWYEAHYAQPLRRSKAKKEGQTESEELTKSRSNKVQRKIKERKELSKIDPLLEDQFITGRLF
ncbi:7775_t:CDS:2, partial [Paraglomus occultum]